MSAVLSQHQKKVSPKLICSQPIVTGFDPIHKNVAIDLSDVNVTDSNHGKK